MITDSEYTEIMKNCSNWNSRIMQNRKKFVYDQQTCLVHRPSGHLFRHHSERCSPAKPMQVFTYPGEKWIKPKGRTMDAIEMSYILRSNPAISEASNLNLNPACNQQQNDNTSNSIDQGQGQLCTPSRASGSKLQDTDVDVDCDIDEGENELSDEDEWSSKKKRKRGGLGASAIVNSSSALKTKKSSSSSVLGPASSIGITSTCVGSESRPFVCQLCGARYKSRPGLTYHRIHVHSNNEVPKSPIISSPKVSVSIYCDFCLGKKDKNARGKPEDLVSCHDCGRSGHPSCLKFTPNMLISTRRHGWQCIECKSCAICGTSENDEQLLFCDDCDRGFHLYCLSPPLKSPPEADWSCHLCLLAFGSEASINKNQGMGTKSSM